MDPLDALDNGDEIARLLEPIHLLILEDAWGGVNDELGIDAVFNLKNPHVQKARGQLAKLIKGVAQTTRDKIESLTLQAADEGWSPADLARKILEQGEIDVQYRAVMIGRTESGTAMNLGAVAGYREASITHVDVFDGDDDEPCASANGARWTLEEAEANPLGHPNCQRAFAAVVSDEG